MNSSVTDAALKAVYSVDADELRRKSRKLLIWSQVFMLLAASPLALTLIGVITSFSSITEKTFPLAWLSMFGGIAATFVTMLIFCPFAFYCVYRFLKSRKSIEALVRDAVRRTTNGQE
jgi:uncharacterized BrkB/YihY/UPF0761 family membrane protein